MHNPTFGSGQDQPILYLPAPRKRNHWIPAGILAGLFLLGTILFFLIPMGTAHAASNSFFTVVDGALYFDQSLYRDGPVLTVPATVDGQAVTSIGDSCFENVTGITTIYLPDTVTAIGERAFSQCDDLRGLSVPEGVHSIGLEAFYGCNGLESLYLPMTLNSIGEDAFEGCSRLNYLFFAGFYSSLYQMYPEMITPQTYAICLDGTYPYAAQ